MLKLIIMFFTSYKHCQCFVLLNIIASQTYAAVTPIKVDCWWTGCQLNTWDVVGCDHYNRTQQNIKYCDGGSEYYCCTAGHENVIQPIDDCWWTGCQLNTWAVVGCNQYNRIQKNIKDCNGGSEYYCCMAGHENDKVNEIVKQPANDCWWTGCQLNTWAVVGCNQYNLTQKNIKNCDGGSEYYCCNAGHKNVNVNDKVNEKMNENVTQPANDCWWTGCQLNTWAVVGCNQYNRIQKNVKDCNGGSEYYCCTVGQENLTQPANECWWTGCQLNTWAVVGCNQYNRIQKNVKDCNGGSEYYCCTAGQENVNDKVNENVKQPTNNCWWTGCQLNTWAVVGCNQYNLTQKNIKNCDGGSEYYCCNAGHENVNVNDKVTEPANDCWWTGCQLNTWAVVGCNQYNRIQKNVKDCNGGSEYYCCTAGQENVNDKVNENVTQPAEDCWWTGCQPISWEVTGCDTYNRTERQRTACEVDGLKYECCARREIDNIDVRGAFFEENCMWSRCQPKEMSGRGCPPNTVQMGLHPCPNGDLFHCCSESISVDVNG